MKMLFRKKHPDSLEAKGQLDVIQRILFLIYHFAFFLIVPLPVGIITRLILGFTTLFGYRFYHLLGLKKYIYKNGLKITGIDQLLYIFTGWVNPVIEFLYIIKGFIRFYLYPAFFKDRGGFKNSLYAGTMLSGPDVGEKQRQDSHSGSFDRAYIRDRSLK